MHFLFFKEQPKRINFVQSFLCYCTAKINKIERKSIIAFCLFTIGHIWKVELWVGQRKNSKYKNTNTTVMKDRRNKRTLETREVIGAVGLSPYQQALLKSQLNFIQLCTQQQLTCRAKEDPHGYLHNSSSPERPEQIAQGRSFVKRDASK